MSGTGGSGEFCIFEGELAGLIRSRARSNEASNSDSIAMVSNCASDLAARSGACGEGDVGSTLALVVSAPSVCEF